MPLIDQIQKDIVSAMKAREEQRLSTLRMVKSALKLREVEKMAPLDDKESQQVLSTLIKQRKDSVEQFTKGGRQEMADKEAAEIKLIEAYLHQRIKHWCPECFAASGALLSSRHWMRPLARSTASSCGYRVRLRTSTLR